MRYHKAFWGLLIIFFAAKADIANGQTKDYLDPMSPQDSAILWHNLLNNINKIIMENSQTNDILEKLNTKQNDQDVKLANFMEKMETQFMDLKNRLDEQKHHIEDLNKGQNDHKRVIDQLMENIKDSDTVNKNYMETMDQHLKDLKKGMNDQKQSMEDLDKRQNEQKIAINQLMENVQHNFKDLQKGLGDHNETTTQFAQSVKRNFEDIEKGQTEQSRNLQTLTDQYLRNNNEWVTILRRQDGSVDFNRNWSEYKRGFGDPDGEFFIGLEKLHEMTSEVAPKELLIILKDFENEIRIARYDSFQIGTESEKYKLKKLGAYSGDAGDSLSKHKGMDFSTYDQDNDNSDRNCANTYNAGWWYKSCYWSNLCGKYRNKEQSQMLGVGWNDWKGRGSSLKYAEMKIRSSFL